MLSWCSTGISIDQSQQSSNSVHNVPMQRWAQAASFNYILYNECTGHPPVHSRCRHHRRRRLSPRRNSYMLQMTADAVCSRSWTERQRHLRLPWWLVMDLLLLLLLTSISHLFIVVIVVTSLSLRPHHSVLLLLLLLLPLLRPADSLPQLLLAPRPLLPILISILIPTPQVSLMQLSGL
jgi:hypothetical protein